MLQKACSKEVCDARENARVKALATDVIVKPIYDSIKDLKFRAGTTQFVYGNSNELANVNKILIDLAVEILKSLFPDCNVYDRVINVSDLKLNHFDAQAFRLHSTAKQIIIDWS